MLPGVKINVHQQIAEIDRELSLRDKLYPGMIARGKLKQSAADYHMDFLRSAKASLEWLRDNREAVLATAKASKPEVAA